MVSEGGTVGREAIEATLAALQVPLEAISPSLFSSFPLSFPLFLYPSSPPFLFLVSIARTVLFRHWHGFVCLESRNLGWFYNPWLERFRGI